MRRSLLAATLAAATAITACSSSDGTSAVPTTDRPAATTTTPAPAPTDSAAPPTSDVAPPTTESVPTAPTDSIAWSRCDGLGDDTLECGTLTVPVDHTRPDGDTLDVALVRKAATGDRISAMLFNPGGPGGSGFDFVASIASAPVLASLNERFDLIGFDPRGVDRSEAIQCVDGPEFDQYFTADPTPETEEEAQQNASQFDDLLTGCQKEYGDRLRYMSTVETAYDMDAIRTALGDDQIAYFGISYGTYLGAVYASLFPERVRAMVLDSAFIPTAEDSAEYDKIQLGGFETSLNELFAWCAADASCAIHGSDPAARWDALDVQLDTTPLESNGRPVNSAVLKYATIGALYERSGWSALTDAIAAAEAGDGSPLQQLADGRNGRNTDGTYNSLATSLLVINCASGLAGSAPTDPEAAAAEVRAAAPRVGGTVSATDYRDNCTPLLGTPAPTPPTIAYSGSGPIVVIGGTSDPATPYEYAVSMVEALGPDSHLVTFDGPGHGQSLATPCLMGIIDALFLSLQVPAAGTVCEPVEVAATPAWWAELPAIPGYQDSFAPGPAFLEQLGFDPSVQYVQGLVTTDSPDAVHELFAQTLGAWTAGTVASDMEGMRRSTFELDGRRLEVVTLDQQLLDSLGAGVVGTLVVLAGS